MRETRSQFRKRVEERVGLSFHQIPPAPKDELVGAHIACRRAGVTVAWVGYPTHEEDGLPFFAPSQARVFRF